MSEDLHAEVVVVGGGPAGLSAAVGLARSRRDVVLVDVGEPRNAPAHGAHNLLGQEGVQPFELLARGRDEALGYGVRIVSGTVTGASGAVDDFHLEVDRGARTVTARRVVLATGLVDQLPDVPGVAEGWGHSVLHCPFCHGWEVRDQRIAVLGTTEDAVHQVVLFRQLSDDVTLFLHDGFEPTEEQRERLVALGVRVVAARVERLVLDGSQVRAVEVEGGTLVETDAVVVTPRFTARTEIYEALGGEPAVTVSCQQVVAETDGATPVPGVWVAGDVSDVTAMVAVAAASGVMAGAAVHSDLADADLARAVQDRRAQRSTTTEAADTQTPETVPSDSAPA